MGGKLGRVIVPMPQFVNPNNSETNAGSINLSLAKHPVEHAESYGGAVSDEGVEPEVEETEADGDAQEVNIPSDLADKPEDEWTVEDLKEALKENDLPVSGNKDELQARWSEFKAQ